MTQHIGDLQLLEELVLGPARGGHKRAEPLAVAKVRPLTEVDLPLLQNPPSQGQSFKPPAQLRHSHHQIARLLAAGKPDQEVALITGYSPAYISSLKHGQDFKDLMAYYSTQKEMIFVEVMERMKMVGLNSIEEIQRRFEDAPESFTNQQLFDLTELMIIKPLKAAAEGFGASRPQGSGVTVNVQFIRSENSLSEAVEGPGEVVDVEPRLMGVR